MKQQIDDLSIHSLSSDRWADFELLFGSRGACGGCWCMYWKLPLKVFEENQGSGNRSMQKAIVEQGSPPGVIAYVDGIPAGWCAIEPRENYSRFEKARTLKPIDDLPVWSITCFFIKKEYRNLGLSKALLRGAVEYALKSGANVIEGYPHDLGASKLPDPFVYTGLVSSFKSIGFVEVARRSEKRPIMRYYQKS